MGRNDRRPHTSAYIKIVLVLGLVIMLGLMLFQQKPTAWSEELTVHFIDVGQGDATLIHFDNHFILIDGGEKDYGPVVLAYLQKQGVTELDWIIATHPHSDHIGGLISILNSIPVAHFMMPDQVHTTQTFEDLLDAIAAKGLKITRPEVGQIFDWGNARLTLIAPNRSEYENLNNYSIGIRLDYGETSFIFTGDAEQLAELDMVHNGLALSADVLKVGHHGSSTSSCAAFLDAVGANYAVISLAADNDYGHPHREVLQRLAERAITVYRTDETGTIVAYSDGQQLRFNSTPSDLEFETASVIYEEGNEFENPVAAAVDSSSSIELIAQVYITPSGNRYHQANCSYLQHSDTTITLEEAWLRGLEPCSRCTPPSR